MNERMNGQFTNNDMRTMQCNSPVQRLRVGAPPAELLELDVSVVEVFPHFTLTGRRSLDSAERRRRSKS